jgi:hypothetical protein
MVLEIGGFAGEGFHIYRSFFFSQMNMKKSTTVSICVSVDKKTIVVLKERVSGRRPTPANDGLPTISGCSPTLVHNGLPSISDTSPSLDSHPTLSICLVKQLISEDSLPVTFVCRRNRFLA